MNIQSLAARFLPPFLVPKAWMSGSVYDSANTSPRRGTVPGAAPTEAARDLNSSVRKELVRKARYLHKNSGFVREIVGNMAIYSTGDGIRVQAQTADKDWNTKAEAYFADWSAKCEITNRFSFAECQALVCRGMDIDGEYFIHKTRNRMKEPVLQLLESHRIGDAAGENETVDGIGVDEFGAPLFYRVVKDWVKVKDVPAQAMLHVYEPEWASALRCGPAIQHSINHVLDEIELLALEKHAVKDNADVSRVITSMRGEINDDGDFQLTPTPAGDDAENTDPVKLQQIVGGKVVNLQPGEKLESFQSARPSPTFTGFLEHLRRDASLGILPYEFAADSSKVGGAGVRLVVAKADRKFSYRQMILERRFIQPVWAYVIGDAIVRGLLDAVPEWWKIATVAPRRITVDAGREAQQHRSDLEVGLTSWSDHFAELGADFREEAERRGADAAFLLEVAKKYAIPLDMLWKPTGAALTPLPGSEPPTSPKPGMADQTGGA